LRTRGIMYRRKGISTILGTLIFIGILFSAVIPMMLTMKQADIFMEQEKLEMQRADDERAREVIDVYAYPEGDDQLQVLVESRCEVPVTITHVWINNKMNQTSVNVGAMYEKIIGNFSITLVEGVNSTFRVKVTTSRGNVFENLAGDVCYDGNDWVTPQLGIYVVVDSEGGGFWGFGSYRCTVENDGAYSETKTESFSFGSVSFFFDTTEVGPDEFHVTVEKRSGWFWGSWNVVFEDDVEISWPSGPAIVWVFTT
jgi:hypothetical protein